MLSLIILFYSFKIFSHQLYLEVFHWSLSKSKSPRVSRTLLNILADLSNAVVWMVSIRPLITKSSGPFTNPLVIVPSAPITIGVTVTFLFHSCCFFRSLTMSKYLSLSFFFFFFFFSVLPAGTEKSTIRQVYFFFLFFRVFFFFVLFCFLSGFFLGGDFFVDYH